ncbi:hypothetical protein BGZ74_004064, partial [Mortierella antarctica]
PFQQLQGQQQLQAGLFQRGIAATQGYYVPKHDSNGFTIRDAWNEYHSHIKEAQKD